LFLNLSIEKWPKVTLIGGKLPEDGIDRNTVGALYGGRGSE
jgi:hypothetical protein